MKKQEIQNKMPDNNSIIIKGAEKLGFNYIDRDIINIGTDFFKDFLLPEGSEELSISCYKIIFEIFKSIYEEQIHKEEEKTLTKQLSLFEDDYMSSDNIYRVLKIKNSKITRNSVELEKAYAFLTDYKKMWYISYNTKGQKIKSYGGLISNPNVNEQKGSTVFLISSFWFKKILCLAENGYNKFLANIIEKTASRQTIRLALWVANRKSDSERLTLEYLNEKFGTNYKSSKQFCKDFLMPKKKFLDKNAIKSFNCKPDGEGHVIFERYEVKTLDQDKLKAPKEVNELKARSYQISYYKKRHNLTEEQVTKLRKETKKGDNKALFDEAYNRLVAFTKLGCNDKYKVMTDYKGKEFLHNFQYFLAQLCEEKGLPRKLWPILN